MANQNVKPKEVDRLYKELRILYTRAQNGIYPTLCAIWFEDRIEILLNNRTMLNMLTLEQIQSIKDMIEKLTKLQLIHEDERMNLVTFQQLFENIDTIGKNV